MEGKTGFSYTNTTFTSQPEQPPLYNQPAQYNPPQAQQYNPSGGFTDISTAPSNPQPIIVTNTNNQNQNNGSRVSLN